MIYTNEMIKIAKEKKKKKQDIINNIITGVLLILIIVCVYFFYQKIVQKENLINFLGYRSFIVLTGSMEPYLHPGDMIFSKTVSESDLKVGDVITFLPAEDSSSTITHRIVDITQENGKTYYQTKGDNNDVNDEELIPIENVVGTMVLKISKARKNSNGINF